jgi:phenylacetic acid degradation operon negative regulatory protein
MSPRRNVSRSAHGAGQSDAPAAVPDAEPLLRPLSARSVIASLLLGMHPPRVRGALLVRWCAHLGIAEGTTRVALSRMVDAGELRGRDGRYELAGPLRRRQPGQDWSLAPTLLRWEGEWVLWLVRPGSRPAQARAELRRAAAAARLAELRDGVWTRPSNLPPEATPPAALETLTEQASTWSGRPAPGSEPSAAELFGLRAVCTRARALLARLDPVTVALEQGDLSALGEAFALGAAALQQVRRDPLLPPALAGPDWPGAELRAGYSRYRAAFAAALADWFAAAEGTDGGAGPI